jgi:hypothetical protein
MEVFAAVRVAGEGDGPLAGASDQLRRIVLDVTAPDSIAEAMTSAGSPCGVSSS